MSFFKKLTKLHEDVVGMNHRNHRLVHPNNPRKYHNLANDKAICKDVLHQEGIATPDTYAVIESMGELNEKLAVLDTLKAVCIKPACGSGGGGILILKRNEHGQWAKPSGKVIPMGKLRMHVANIIFGMFSKQSRDKAILEYCLQPHPFFSAIYAGGVPDFRVILLRQQPVLAMLRLPTDQSDGKANLHAGAIGVGVDLEDGTVLAGYDGKRSLARHPDTGVRFKGKQIPSWSETLEISRRTAGAFPLDYLGVDIVFDKDLGPMVIEINVRPGIQIQNVHSKGLKAVLKAEGLLTDEK